MKEVHTGKTAYDLTINVTDLSTDSVIMFRAQRSLCDLTAAKLLTMIFKHFLDILIRDPSLSLENIPKFSDKQLSQAVQIGHGRKIVSG
ncbi:hypothetical protein RRF57_012063 [Xylaria bambusicola]|uniref:Uncharacterized protein n=1 Tax=Xylaria bambusicola TaxID=326684 RepID=A0AAN7ZDF5_9PEZI